MFVPAYYSRLIHAQEVIEQIIAIRRWMESGDERAHEFSLTAKKAARE